MSEFKECQTPDAAAAEAEWLARGDNGLPKAVWQAVAAIAGGLAIVAVPYLVALVMPADAPEQETVAELIAWVPDDGTPFVRIFERHAEPVAVVDSDPTGGGEAPLPDVPTLVVDPLGPTATESTTTVVDIVEAAPDAGPSEVDSHVAEVVADVPPPEPVNPYSRIKIPEETWAGQTTFIEDPAGVMNTFYASLAEVALKTPGAKVRISQWGDSVIAADGMTSAARRLLQRTFGDGGHGYAMLAANNPWYRRKDIDLVSTGWQEEEFIRSQAEDGRYGFGGVAASGYQGSKATFKTIDDPNAIIGKTASEMHIYYLVQKGGGTLTVKVDGVEQKTIDTRASADAEKGKEKVDKVEVVKVPDGAHTFELRNSGGGRTKVYGVAIERAEGVVYDGMGVVGARDTRWLQADAEHTKGMLAMRSPDLSILMYGGNMLVDDNTMDWYRDKLTQVVRLWRAGLPTKSCLVMSPIDHGERHRGRVRTVPRQLDIMKVQKEVAIAEGCAWFSIYDAMGGDGSIGEWLDKGLANSDLAHPTGKGSVELGLYWYKAIMKGFADFLATRSD